MSESKKLFATALKHSAFIDDAYHHQGGRLLETEDSLQAIQALVKYRLAWRLDEDNVQLSSPVLKLLERFGNSAKRLKGSEAIASLWNQLDYLLQDYDHLNKKNRTSDLERTINDIHECALEIIEALDDQLDQFAKYIDQQFSTVSDLELRIRHNERAIDEAERLNNLLLGCDINDLQVPYQDRQLTQIFRGYLPKKLESCRKELVNILHSLRTQITKLQADNRLAKQLIAFKRHFDLNPGFKPTEVSLTGKLPVILTQAHKVSLFGFPDITNDTHIPTIQSAIAQVKRKILAENQNNPELEINDATEQPPATMDISELYEKSLAVIAVAKGGMAISAADAYRELAIQAPYDHWLLAILNTLSGLDNEEKQSLTVNYDSLMLDSFNGNQIVRDVLLS